jgi:signal transduction histidine kinase
MRRPALAPASSPEDWKATVIQNVVLPSQPASRDEIHLLIADVAALTTVPPPQLRSWEQAGLIHPRRSPNAIRLYSIEDVARVRLVKRSLINPGRRGSLRRLVKALAEGTLAPGPEDYEGLITPTRSAPMAAAHYWAAVVGALADPLVICDTDGMMTYANAALKVLVPEAAAEQTSGDGGLKPASPVALPPVLDVLPLRWSALTGTRHHDVELLLPGPTGAAIRTLWTVTPLRDEDGGLHGAVGVGRQGAVEESTQPGELLAMAAHDLRSPVTVILGRTELARRVLAMLRVADTPRERQEAADRLDQHLAASMLSTVDLMHMMGTLLDASAAAHGALVQQLDPAGVALNLLARQALDHAREHTSRHEFTLEAPATPLLVVGDPVRLRQVFDNLLGNAVKYAPDGGPIILQLEPATSLPMLPDGSDRPMRVAEAHVPGWAVVRVRDPGLGIPAEAIPHVFDRFWRAQGVTHHIRGTGLGLYTSRAIVEAHGGHIWVESSVPVAESKATADGRQGTTIALVLPLVSLPQPPAALDIVAADAPTEPPSPRKE